MHGRIVNGIVDPERQREVMPLVEVSPVAPRDHWAVTVWFNGQEVVTLSSQHVSGREISKDDEEAIREAAGNLLGFIGGRWTA